MGEAPDEAGERQRVEGGGVVAWAGRGKTADGHGGGECPAPNGFWPTTYNGHVKPVKPGVEPARKTRRTGRTGIFLLKLYRRRPQT